MLNVIISAIFLAILFLLIISSLFKEKNLSTGYDDYQNIIRLI